MPRTSHEGSWASNDSRGKNECSATKREKEKDEVQLPGYHESQEVPCDDNQNSNKDVTEHWSRYEDEENSLSTGICPLPQRQKHTCQSSPLQASRPNSGGTICRWECLQHDRRSSSDTLSSSPRIRSAPSYQLFESHRCSNSRHSTSTNNSGQLIRLASNSITHCDPQHIPEPSGLAEPKLPNGSFLSNRSHYPSEATISTNQQSLASNGTFDAVRFPSINCSDVEAGQEYRDGKTKAEDEAQTQANKSHWIDLHRERFRDEFYRYNLRIQICSLLLGLVVFLIMLALLVAAGCLHSQKLARGSFTGCLLIITACCGAFAAAIERSFGEVIIMMTMVVVVGILVAQQLDVWMDTRS